MGWTWYTECGSEKVLGQGWWTWYRASKWTWSTAGESTEKDRSCRGAGKGLSALAGRKSDCQGQKGGAVPLAGRKKQLPGAEKGPSALGGRKRQSPRAEKGFGALGNAGRLVVGVGGKQRHGPDGLCCNCVFPTGPISARGKHGNPPGTLCGEQSFPTHNAGLSGA